MQIKLRDYQVNILKQVNQEFDSGTKELVIAAAPSSGKTVVAISFIKSRPNDKFLVLTHGTNVLKSQWTREFKDFGVKASTIPGKFHVTYGIPQGRKHLEKLNNLDYLIIDEAHEFTFAKTVQNLIATLKPKHIIYLTGTPSKFVAKKTKIICIPAMDLIKQGHVADLYIGLTTTGAKLDSKDFNSEGDVKEAKAAKLEVSVEGDLDELLKSIHSRLEQTHNKTYSMNWDATLGKLHKTMIACRSTIQARKVEDYFNSKGIKTISSNYKTDPDSYNIERFLKENDIRILVVVDRGILGFNMPSLVNVVDLTCSRNIDRIYQLYARVMRKHPDYENKYFFKFSPKELMVHTKFYMNAALNLMREDFILQYSGLKSLNQLKIPVKRKERTPNNETTDTVTSYEPNEEIFYGKVQAHEFLIDALDKQCSADYAYVTFGTIKTQVFGYQVSDWEGRLKQLFEWSNKHKRRPSSKSKDAEEHQAGTWFRNNKNEKPDHVLLQQYLIKFPPNKFSRERALQDLLKWSNKTGKRPSHKSNDKAERCLANFLTRNHKNPDLASYIKKYPSHIQPFNIKLNELWLWSKKHGRRPKRTLGSKERALHLWLAYNIQDYRLKPYLKTFPHSVKKKIHCKTNNTIYESAAHAARCLNLTSTCIRKVLNGQNTHTKGYTFSYVDES